MMELPHGMTGALHILPWWIGWLILIGVLFSLAFLFMKYIAPLLKKKSLVPAAPAPPEEPGKGSDVGSAIDAIQQEYTMKRAYRAGLFELSRFMKSFLEMKTGLAVEKMTGDEIGKSFQGAGLGKFFLTLEGMAFRKQNPTEQDLSFMCRSARGIPGKKPKRNRNAGRR